LAEQGKREQRRGKIPKNLHFSDYNLIAWRHAAPRGHPARDRELRGTVGALASLGSEIVL
jgi:hypothetical protein